MADSVKAFVDAAVARIGRGADKCIPLLQAVQEEFRWLPPEAIDRLCETTDLTPAAVTGVSSFYSQFRHRPAGQFRVKVCHGTACHVKGAPAVTDSLRKHLCLCEGEDTDADGVFTLEKVACLGCCTLAPVVQIEDVTYGHISAETAPRLLRDFLELQSARPHRPKRARRAGKPTAEVRVGLGSCCVARGSGGVYKAAQDAIADLGAPAELKTVGCVGMCHQTPLLEIVQGDGREFLYAQVQPEDTRAILARHLPAAPARRIATAATVAVDRLLTDEVWKPVTRYSIHARDPHVKAFLGPQKNIATEYCGEISPTDLDEYIAKGGFSAARKVLRGELSPEELIEAVAASGLRGRGGAGYPTGLKWGAVRDAPGDVKYVVCNGDEGDPGAFMDRMLLESYPYRVLEGVLIAARAVGASEGFLYIRAEYPLAVKRVRAAIDAMTALGLLGEDIEGGGFSLSLRIVEGAGAFVCGEETALLASIEGRRGMPRLRPPYPSASGLWGRPTLVNNTETFALVPYILREGPQRFADVGTETSKGTKVFALAGKVQRGGLIEVPMGVTIRQIVEQIGGGVAGGKRFKAVQVGGPSGGCVPAELADTPIDFEALTAAGAIMGSGGLVVLDEDDCMVEIARYFLEFTQDQSCGKCTFCRVGTRRMLEVLTRLCDGGGREGDVELLDELARQIQRGSLCGLGKTAPNPVLSTIQHFRHEYEAHIAGRCPAAACKALITYSITDDCIGCTKCAQHCPTDAIAMRPYEKHEIDPDKCVRCGACKAICPAEAVRVE